MDVWYFVEQISNWLSSLDTVLFCISMSSQYYEPLKLYYGSHSLSLELKLTGEGIDPHVELLPEGDVCDVGQALVSDTMTKTLQVST